MGLASLIELRKWKKLNMIIGRSKNRKSCSCTCTRCSEESLLHLACKLRPPLSVLRNLYAREPFNASKMDSDRRYPLHHALEHKSSIEVLQFLIKKNRLAVKARDVSGRTPLYIAVQQCRERWERQTMGSTRISLETTYVMNVIDLLCDTYPALALVEDENGMSALEYAIIAELDGRVICTLAEKMQKGHIFNMMNQSKTLSSSSIVAHAAYSSCTAR